MSFLPGFSAGMLLGSAAGGGGPTDPHWASVVLQSHFTGANGSTTFTDQSASGKTMTAVGNAQILNNKLELDGTGDCVSVADSADWYFGSGDFTIELFGAEVDVLTATQMFISQYENGGSQKSWYFAFTGAATPKKLQGYYSLTGASDANVPAADWTPSTATPYKLTYERSGTALRIYIDGAVHATAAIGASDALHNSTAPLRIGAASNGGLYLAQNGRVEAICITKGVARFNGAHTPRSLPLPTS